MDTSNTATAEERRDDGPLAGLAATIKQRRRSPTRCPRSTARGRLTWRSNN